MKVDLANLSFCESSCDCPEGFMCYEYVRGMGVCVQENKSFSADIKQEEQSPKENDETQIL